MSNACRKLPYQEKHVLQQASILGNLEDLGGLSSLTQAVSNEECDISSVVEFGAGRGYLTQILADSYGIRKVFLVERKSYKLKVSTSKFLRHSSSIVHYNNIRYQCSKETF